MATTFPPNQARYQAALQPDDFMLTAIQDHLTSVCGCEETQRLRGPSQRCDHLTRCIHMPKSLR